MRPLNAKEKRIGDKEAMRVVDGTTLEASHALSSITRNAFATARSHARALSLSPPTPLKQVRSTGDIFEFDGIFGSSESQAGSEASKTSPRKGPSSHNLGG